MTHPTLASEAEKSSFSLEKLDIKYVEKAPQERCELLPEDEFSKEAGQDGREMSRSINGYFGQILLRDSPECSNLLRFA